MENLKDSSLKRRWPLKSGDYAIILIAVALTGFSAFMIYGRQQDTRRIMIQGAAGSWVFPLDAEEEVVVQGPLGETIVSIHNGSASVISSPCANQTCIAAGHINREGEWVACLPNNVIITIEGTGNESSPLDTTAW